MNISILRARSLRRAVIVRFAFSIPLLSLMFFGTAGTVSYWEAWVYLVQLTIAGLYIVLYLLKHSPELLERRMKMREQEPVQKLIIAVAYPVFLVTFLLPGLDRRYSWSTVPAPVVMAADGVVLLGFALCFLVFRENRYASRIVVVKKDQKVITTGPYALVRHPMYAAVLLIYLCTPVALGSYWAMVPASSSVALLVARIGNEELTLSRGLEGYHEYKENVKYRLVPGVW